MAFYSTASNKSLWRGVNYYEEDKVLFYENTETDIFKGVVEGSDGNRYDTTIDLNHPKKSTCTCPFAEGRKVICKHMIALYFTCIPGSYEAFEKDLEEMETQYKIEQERWEQSVYLSIKKEVNAMSAKDAKQRLIEVLFQNELDSYYRDDNWWR